MIKKLLSVTLFTFLAFPGLAQVGNEWINFSQVYFKIPVAKDGMYSLSYPVLQAAGFPVDDIDPRKLQIFHRGKEQAIRVQGEADTHFDPPDFIEFYGKKNDGTLDAELYRPSSSQPHPYYNLYNDTTSYFLTYNPLPILGKRMNVFSEVNVTNIPKETFHTDEKLLVLSDIYSFGVTYDNYIQSSLFDQAEGWSGVEIRQTLYQDYALTNISQMSTTQGNPQLEIGLTGRGDMQHEAQVSVGPNPGTLRTLTTQDFNGYTTFIFTQTINWGDIGPDGKLYVRVMANGVGGEPDRFSVLYIKLRYPQKTDAAAATEKVFNLAVNPSGKSYLEIQNPAIGSRLFDITDPDNPSSIGTTSSGTLNAVVSSTSVSRKIFMTSVDNVPASIKQVTFRNIVPADYNYIIISNRLLMKPALGYSDVVRAYADYRASAAGGLYDTLVVEVNQLYDQFNYGEVSPLAIFHFMKFLCASHPPEYLFIIGKGLSVDYKYYRNPAAFTQFKDLVPTSGVPPSDSFFSIGLAGTTHEPAVPTGRITASSPAQVAAYLNKVKEMEALPYDALWRKNLLHLSGGIATDEPQEFRGYMQDFQHTAEGYHLGGKVKALAKQNTDIQLINISAEVNKGLNLVTFFGHSSPSLIDFDIGFVSDPVLEYNNPGKYPTLLMNGCNAGAFFLYGTLFGEDWINTANKGAVGFMAYSSYGFVNYLKKYSDLFYSVGYGDSTFIQKGLGDIQKQVAKEYAATSGGGVFDDAQIQQMMLLGDPAVRLFGAKKADYEVNDNNISLESFDGSPINALTDSFALKFVVRNFGQAKEPPLVVELTRTFSDNSSVTEHKIFSPVLYSDTLMFVIKKNSAGFGTNTFKIKVDSDDAIPELNENNNTATKGIVIPSNGTKNLFPYDYAIVNTGSADLTFQSTDLLSGARDFIVEIDTASSFASAFKKQFAVKGIVLVKQSVALLAQDTLVYYWRTKLAKPVASESTEWIVSSFTYINNGSDGWAQVQFPQYLKNESIGLVRDTVARKFRFQETKADISIKTFGSNNPATNHDVSIKINDSEYNIFIQSRGCRTNSINLIAFDKTSLSPYEAIPFSFNDARNCGREPQVINNFVGPEIETGIGGDIFQYIDNVVTGDSVVLFSMGDAGFTSWSLAVKNKLGQLGISAAQINTLQPGEPVVFFGKKGAPPGSARQYKTSSSPANQQTLVVNETITGRYTFGKMNSVVIGPAQHWQKFINKVAEIEPTDQVSFDILGIKLNNQEQILLSDIFTDQDLSGISATDYPYLRVVYKAEDDVNLTASQLKKWLVLYEPVAEGLLLYQGSHNQQVFQEGQHWTGNFSFVNIGNKLFSDSLTVQYQVFNTTHRTLQQKNLKILAPALQDTTQFSISIDTHSKVGLNDVDVFVNPYVLPEQYYNNNEINLPGYLNVLGDVYNPVLDVTIDGRYVLNDDFVSPNPGIVIKVWDENKIIIKKDTVGMNVFMKYPCSKNDCEFQRFNFSGNTIQWFPATDTSYFKIKFNPQNLPEGPYTLRIESSDASGNSSGTDPYLVTFQVKYETAFTLLSPSPNPSDGTFFFSFVVSGSEVPDYFNLQILSVQGMVVNEISLQENSFYIGKNNVTWNGKDGAGHDLPSGVYAYRLLIRSNHQEARKNGKLVLIK